MPKARKSIAVNRIADEFSHGMAIERLSMQELLLLQETEKEDFVDAKQPHREDRHTFFLLEEGSVSVEIDFRKHRIKSHSVIYMHPDQVHRILAFENVVVCSWGIDNENLNPVCLKALEQIKPSKPLALKKDMFSLISEAVSLCIKFSNRPGDKLYHSLLKDSFNALIALVASQYLKEQSSTGKLTRFEVVTKSFKQLLELNYTSTQRPAEYAKKLNISTAYLNECVKNTTGNSVSYHIQQRVILEAKRLLYHSDKSVKEIASELGYDDYPYFTRLFSKVTGMTAISFRAKNRD